MFKETPVTPSKATSESYGTVGKDTKEKDTKKPDISAKHFLSCAFDEMTDREEKYDQPSGERSMKTTVELFAILTGVSLSETDGWKFMQLLKLVRSQYNGYRKDDYVDMAAYASLAGESASKESGA